MAQTQVYTDTIAAYFDDSSDARKAVDALQDAGFTSAHLGIAHRGSYTGSDSTVGNSTVHETTENGPSTWDKIKSWFSGEEAEPYADERLQRDPAQQEVVPPAERYDEGYDDTSDLHGSFTAMNIPTERARYFSHRFSRGTHGAVVTVQAGDRKAEAESILNKYNADFGENAGSYDYSSEAGAYQYDGRDRSDRRSATASTDSIDTNRNTDVRDRASNVQLLGEVLRVHKDRVNRGEVRIRKEVVTENQNIQVPVQREELVVERRPVTDGRPATGTLGEEEIRVPLSEERATLDKSTVVREEVNVSKKPVEEVRDLTGEVRHEELVVDDSTQRKRSA
ncbi:YsnF/AvaK domain-containing protein [Occallatibacter savannae]|uniref:YsnF/AvaK domain-containing protein n=1 Tax=Occallatibacter savannae TaxID=1002691 RepID=UPI0013A5809E|nr:YsnF/AvaK domain-containing protein [Occallatibacter savannae]